MEPKAETPKAEAAARMVKQMGLTIKASSLYPTSHPGNALAVETLLVTLRGYLEAYGALSVHVGRQTLSVDGTVIPGGPSTSLAYALYTRKLIRFSVVATVDQQQLGKFVSILGTERAKPDATGGISRLLSEAGVADIQVKELAMGENNEVEVLGQDAFHSLLGQGRLTPEEGAQVIEILHSGPEDVGNLLSAAYALAGEALEGTTEEGRADQLLRATQSVDRLILNEPLDQHGTLYSNLAQALLMLEKPLGPSLMRTLLDKASEDVTAQVILEHLSSDQIADVILKSLGEGGVIKPAGTGAGGVRLGYEKAKTVLALVEMRLREQGKYGPLITEAVERALQPVLSAAEEDPLAVEFDESQITVSDEEMKRCLREAHGIDEAGSIRDVVRTLVDVLADSVEKEELVDVAETLAGYVSGLVEHRDFAVLREILQRVKTIAATAGSPLADVVNGLLKRIAEGPGVESLMAALWEMRMTPSEQEIQACVEVLADQLVRPLVRILGEEPRAGMRAMLRDLLVRIGSKHIDELGAFITDSRWYLVRNIADILGRLRSPEGIPYLVRLVRHWEPRVRTQAMDALVSIGTDAAQETISAFLDDREERIRLRALRSLDARGLPMAMPALRALLEAQGPSNRSFGLRQAGIETVARLGARDAIPALKKIAHTSFVFNKQGRELRRLARMALARIEGAPAVMDQAKRAS